MILPQNGHYISSMIYFLVGIWVSVGVILIHLLNIHYLDINSHVTLTVMYHIVFNYGMYLL